MVWLLWTQPLAQAEPFHQLADVLDHDVRGLARRLRGPFFRMDKSWSAHYDLLILV